MFYKVGKGANRVIRFDTPKKLWGMVREELFLIKKLCSIGVIFLLTGCGGAVTVNNVSIPNSQIDAIVKAQEQLMGKVSNDQEKALRLDVINNVVNQNLLIQEAQKRGIKVSDSEVEKNYSETLKSWNASGEMQKSLKAQGYTLENMKDMVKNQLLIQALSDSLVTVTDEELTNFFKSHSYEYTTYTALKAEGKTEAEAREKLSSVKEVSLGYSELPLQIQQEIQVNKLVLNQLQTFKLNDKAYEVLKITATGNQTLEEVKNQVEQAFRSQTESTKVQDLLTQLKSNANIKTD
ncbi:SurA-like protein (plasmid) [Desulfosporosinus acidiphilus SJ4]|uniref:SurA-like protein n=1 Tax=Desulfosporosinus acidiphilus (strain DSM 22704 / JCM 16185 / SJ4) TaxID=646529 RepID=I4DCP4_DESAJ|nr:SurA-like protein [Desulfosporosinus acidiphilus SJ4]